MNFKRRVFEIVEAPHPSDTVARAFGAAMVALIALNVAAIILATVESVNAQLRAFFDVFELLSVIVFSAEYVLRLWTCTLLPQYAAPITGRLRFALKPLVIADLLSILPFYLPFLGVDLRVVRAVRMFRLFRVVKLGRYSKALQSLGQAIVSRKEELLVSFFVLILLLILTSSLMYFVEHDAQPDKFSSIPAAMWWAVVTLTTVGYGDVFPMTDLGKVLACVVAVLGVGMVALPTAILGAAFIERIQKKHSPAKCPHCGKDLDSLS